MQQKKTTKEEYQKCVNVVVEYINQHLGEDIDLKSLAKISNFSPFYFHRIMKAFLGEPIGTFIVRTRTEAAARLLRYSDIPIADIAYRIGYSSPSSLSKVFRQFYGISPLEYRNNKNFVIMKPAIIRPDLELKSEIKSIPARNVIYIRLSGDYKLNDYGGTWGRLWQFIKEHVIDKRTGSEWFWEVHPDGSPIADRPIVEPWKCPYHNGRMCMEVIRRL